MQRQHALHPDIAVPHFVKVATQFLVHRGLSQEGLFRLSGTQAQIVELKAKVNAGEELKLGPTDDVHNVRR